MSRFALFRHLLATTGGGGGPLAISYDTRFGTDSPTTIAANGGWFTFALKGGNRRVWCDDQRPDDSGNGLTAATAKKTLPAAVAVFTNGSWTQSDQLMLAGGSLGGTYTDDALSQGWGNFTGVSATYPTAVLCYDRDDPTNTAKYGKLLGQKKPRYVIPSQASVPSYLAGSTRPFIENPVDSGSSCFFMQGINLDGQNVDGIATGTVGRHDYTGYQNCQFKQVSLGNNNANSAHGKSVGLHFSKCSFYGTWRALDGNTNGTFADDVDGMYVQDNVGAHCGWKMYSSRDDATADGGNGIFGHAFYYAAGNVNGKFDRNVCFDNATDGQNLRGSAASTQSFHIDEPTAFSVTGYSSSYLDNPAGSVVTYDDFVVAGGSDLWSALATGKSDGNRGNGFGGRNSALGSYVNNGVMFDNPRMNGPNSHVADLQNPDPNSSVSSYTISNIRCHNYSAVALSFYYADVTKISVTFHDCLFDNLGKEINSGTIAGNISGTNVRTWISADYPNALTKNDLITALGFANKAAMCDAMIEYPHLPWAQVAHSIAFPAYGATPIYATVAVATLTAALAALPAPTALYNKPLVNLSLTASSFPHATASSTLITGCSINFALSSSDLPSGWSIIGTRLSIPNSVTAGTYNFHVLETNNDGLGTHTTALTVTIT